MIAVANVLSFVKIDMPMGGGLTVCSMVPIVFLSLMYGPVWGLSTAFIYSVFQLLFGLDNVAYATNAGLAVLIILFDYVVAYTVVGLAGFFGHGRVSAKRAVLASATVLLLRFACHFVTGWFVWDALWPNEFGLSSAVYSFVYNGIYMLPEIVITSTAVALLCSSDQIVGLVADRSLKNKDGKGGGRLLIGIGAAFIAIQLAAYVGLYVTDALTFFADTSSFKAIMLGVWELFSSSLVGIIGAVFAVCGIISVKRSKKSEM